MVPDRVEGSATAKSGAREPLVAVITMVRNEAAMLPRWVQHYEKQCGGAQHLIIIDDNSTDGSTDDLPCSVIRIPPLVKRAFEPARLGLVSHFASGLLEAYDAVAFTDADEFLVADPAKYSSLRDLVGAKPDTEVFGAMGLNLVQHVGVEPPLDPLQPLLGQRSLAKFIPLMCKPSIKRIHPGWTAASHGLKRTPWTIDPDLYMFHAKFADRDALHAAASARKEAVRNDKRPRKTNWKFGGDAMVSLLDSVTKDIDVSGAPPFEPDLEFLAGVVREEDDTFRARGSRQVPSMKRQPFVRVPERFFGIV